MREQPGNRILNPAALGSVVSIQRRDDGVDVVYRRITVRLSVVLEIHWFAMSGNVSCEPAGNLHSNTLCRRVFDLAIVEATPRSARHGMILTLSFAPVSPNTTHLVHRLPQLYTRVSLS
jgi:hypothetical protein